MTIKRPEEDRKALGSYLYFFLFFFMACKSNPPFTLDLYALNSKEMKLSDCDLATLRHYADTSYCRCECVSERHKVFMFWDYLNSRSFLQFGDKKIVLGEDENEVMEYAGVKILGAFHIREKDSQCYIFISYENPNFILTYGPKTNAVLSIKDGKMNSAFQYHTRTFHKEGEPCTSCVGDYNKDGVIDFVQMQSRSWPVDTIYYVNFINGAVSKKDSGYRYVWDEQTQAYDIVHKRKLRGKKFVGN